MIGGSAGREGQREEEAAAPRPRSRSTAARAAHRDPGEAQGEEHPLGALKIYPGPWVLLQILLLVLLQSLGVLGALRLSPNSTTAPITHR